MTIARNMVALAATLTLMAVEWRHKPDTAHCWIPPRFTYEEQD